MKMKRVDPAIWRKLKDVVGKLHDEISDENLAHVYEVNKELSALVSKMPSGATVIINRSNTKQVLISITNRIKSCESVGGSQKKQTRLFEKYIYPLLAECEALDKCFAVRIAALKEVHGDEHERLGHTIYAKKTTQEHEKVLTRLSSLEDLKKVFQIEYAKSEYNQDADELYKAEQKATFLFAEQLKNNEFKRIIENFKREVNTKLNRLHNSTSNTVLLTLPVIVVTPPETIREPFEDCIYHTLKHGCYLIEEQPVFAHAKNIAMDKRSIEELISGKTSDILKVMHDKPMNHHAALEYNFWWCYPKRLINKNTPITIEITGIAFEDYNWLLFPNECRPKKL